MDRKLSFVVSLLGAPGYQAVFTVDIRDNIMMLNEKAARGRGMGAPLESEISIEKVRVSGERVSFIGHAVAIEGTLIAAFTSFSQANGCYRHGDLKTLDARWQPQTSEVLSLFDRPSFNECQFAPAIMATA